MQLKNTQYPFRRDQKSLPSWSPLCPEQTSGGCVNGGVWRVQWWCQRDRLPCAQELGREVPRCSLPLAQPPGCCAGCALPGPQQAVTPCTVPCTQAVIPSPGSWKGRREWKRLRQRQLCPGPFPGHGEGRTYVIQAQYICAYRKLLWCLCERTVTYSGCNELSWGAAKSLQAVAAMHRCKTQTEAAGTAFIRPLALPS